LYDFRKIGLAETVFLGGLDWSWAYPISTEVLFRLDAKSGQGQGAFILIKNYNLSVYVQ
jgi:hypothetical protein